MRITSCWLSIAGLLAFSYAQGDGLIVSTEQGAVTGTLASPTVRQWLGVPYAAVQRWSAPSKPPARSGTLNATTFSDSCVQLLSPSSIQFLKLAGGMGIDVPESEDCHTVNIWSPSVNRKQNTAVLVWIYGGSFQFGTSNIPYYHGTKFVQNFDDITVVTFNYRLNIFGQPNAPQLAGAGQAVNFGLLDIEAAIQWVHDNIGAFGGDPNRLVLFGESAGGVATDAYTFSHPQSTFVKGKCCVIEQSGNLVLGSRIAGPANATSWNTVASAVGCGNNANAAQLDCMKYIPFRTLRDAVLSTDASFNPNVDGVTVFSDFTARAAAGNFLQVPVLSGSNKHEADIFVLAANLASGRNSSSLILHATSDLITKVGFTCPAGTAANQRADKHVPAWRYKYQAIFADISTHPDLRAFHASEIPIVFGNYPSTATANEKELSAYVQGAWVAFAKDPQRGLLDYGWPTYTQASKSLAELGNGLNPTEVRFTRGIYTDFGCLTLTALSSLFF